MRPDFPPPFLPAPDFNPRTPCGVRPHTSSRSQALHPDFNPRTPCGVRRVHLSAVRPASRISIHAPRVGCDPTEQMVWISSTDFNPRTPCGVRPMARQADSKFLDFNPRTPCGVRPQHLRCRRRYRDYFNPRTPCGVRRRVYRLLEPGRINFNPRTPCGVRRLTPPTLERATLFQSTHPVWGATVGVLADALNWADFNPRTPCGVRPACATTLVVPATNISIHAPRVGCDMLRRWPVVSTIYFNPRTPCGVRQSTILHNCAWSEFQSTHPVWGATR